MTQGLAIEPTSRHRYRQLDSLRGLAALTVFIGHCAGVKINMPLQNAIYPTPIGILFNGNAAVVFFFVLSGFVLSLPFINSNRPLQLIRFYVRRIFRLYPAFIVAILLSLFLKEFVYDRNGIVPFSDWLKSFWTWGWNRENVTAVAKSLMLVAPGTDTRLLDPPIWSLVTEMKMSLILPFFIFIASRCSPTLNILILLIIICFTGWGITWAAGIFYLGVLLAKYKDDLIIGVQRWRRISLLAVIIMVLFLYNNTFEFLKGYQQLEWPFKWVWSNYITAMGSLIIIVIALARKRIANLLKHKVFTFLGDISYSFYLVHFPVLLTVSSLFGRSGHVDPLFIFLVAFVLSVVISWLIVVLIERPFQLMGRKVFS